MKYYKFKDKLWVLKQLDTGRNKRFPERNNIIQSMSPKGNSLAKTLKEL